MRNRVGDDMFVEFVRGDTGQRSMDDYTHNWGEHVRETYYNYIYKLL